MNRVIRPIALSRLCLPLALLLGGCGENPVSFYEAPREDPAARPPGPLAGMRSTNAAVAPVATGLVWSKPEIWIEKPASGMRLGSFAFIAADGREADISVFSFPGATGGLLANINRWRGQVGLPAVEEGDLDATTEPGRVAGLPARLVDLAGTASGTAPAMGAAQSATGPTRILGAIVPVDDKSWFFKMMGPDDVVVSQRETFQDFLASITTATSAPAAASVAAVDPHAGIAGAPPLRPGQAGMDPSAVPPPPTPDGFHFDLPEGWQPQGRTTFRVASFKVPGEGVEPADVSVSAFPGMGDQDLDNVNRWRGQVGLPPVGPSELASLTRTLENEQHTFHIYEFESPAAMAQGGGRVRMLAAIMKSGETSWFFKMTGESSLVAAQREAFARFVRSFHLDETR